jgi:hypothetical protein
VDEGTGRRRRTGTGQRRRVNYAGLDVEEFGSVYESLLDYHPHVSLDPPRFDLLAGSERKQTGSYYTPPELVRELIQSALVPVMQERLAKAKTKEEKEEALLGLRVCDPAAGSGHFLLAAARRIARELARARSGEEEPPPEQYRHALRDVIRHCIYAVDKNPLAVDLCKVALWIEGHNAGLPLSFLDNHVKCGDSLVGVAALKVLEQGVPDDAYKPVTGDDKAAASAYRKRNKQEREGQLALAAAAEPPKELAEEFRTLGTLEERTPAEVEAKEGLYESLRGSGSDWWRLKVACDLWTYAFFAPLRPPGPDGVDRVPTTDAVRRYLLQPQAANAQLLGEAVGYSQEHPFFHWPLEFPDVFASDGFDVVLGNPPFLGSKKIKGVLGDNYREYIMSVLRPTGGLSDLCAYFLRRLFNCLRPNGQLGFVATNSIGQGDTREGGLAIILERGVLVHARRFIKWPGVANLEVNLLALRKGKWEGKRYLDGQTVAFISSRLDAEPEAQTERLLCNRDKAFIGSVLSGTGFVLDAQEASTLIGSDRRNRDCLFPYLVGEDLNSRPDQSPARWVINFFDWPLDRAASYPALLEIARQRVKPHRDTLNRERYRDRWWLYAEGCPGLYRATSGLSRVLARSRVSELHMLAFVATRMVYGDATVAFAFDDDYHFALLQSNVHEVWVRRNASTMRTDIRYTPTDCFDTFPLPQETEEEERESAARVGAEYHEHRRWVMLARNQGLTKTYNLFHNSDCQDEDIVRLRELHVQMDRAILAGYGWQDLDPGHGFHQNERGQTRYTVSPEARREILRRLLELNLKVAAEEEASGTAKGR